MFAVLSTANIIKIYGYLERTSCIGCGSGFQPRSFNFAAGSRSHSEFLEDIINLTQISEHYTGVTL